MKLDAPLYTEEELDALESENPREALRIAREQAMLKRQLEQTPPLNAVMPEEQEIQESIQEVRKILLRDGGDLDFVAPGKSGLFFFENLTRSPGGAGGKTRTK